MNTKQNHKKTSPAAANLQKGAGLFEGHARPPLADRMRPQTLEDIFGQDHLLGQDGALRRVFSADKKEKPFYLSSMILWGPPGCGKTTLARLIAKESHFYFEPLSAIFSGVSDLRKIFDAAAHRREMGERTVLFVDEIHRFNRAQQDGFLPYVEDGTVILIGATTENPSFELNSALLSRCQVFVLKRLDEAALQKMLLRVEAEEKRSVPLDRAAKEQLLALADGDGRALINMCEMLYASGSTEKISPKRLMALIGKKFLLYDKGQEYHYNLISTLHKAIRGSDCDAALYWLGRMLEGGEDPLYIARRLVRIAYEDIGLADPQAVQQALSAWQTYERLGSPEGEISLTQVVIYLACAPKSNAVYTAFKQASRLAKEKGSLNPPSHSLNAPTKMMKDLGYGKNYVYDHNLENAFSGLNYFPEEMARHQIYDPVERGFERELKKRLNYWDRLRQNKINELE